MRTDFNSVSSALALAIADASLAELPRNVKSRVNTEIECALKELKASNPAFARRLRSINDESSVAGSYAGDTWRVVFDLCSYTEDKPERFPAMKEASEKRVRAGVYGAILQRMGLHRTQLLDRYVKQQALAKQEAESAPEANNDAGE